MIPLNVEIRVFGVRVGGFIGDMKKKTHGFLVNFRGFKNWCKREQYW